MIRARLSHIGQHGLLAALVLAAVWILWTELRPPASAANQPQRDVAITATPLPGAGTTIGPFRLRSVVALASPDKAFGGLSGLVALPDGRLLAVTDAGDWLIMQPGATRGTMGSITMPGEAKSDRDAEAIAFTPAGETLVSLEQQHRIARFAGHGPPLTPVGPPVYRTDTMGWPPNGGGEALAVLGDGQLLWISEAARDKAGRLVALLIAADGKTRTISIDGLAGFSPTDAVMWDAGHMLVVHRRYTGVETAAAISLVDLAPVLAGGNEAPARVLARWGPGVPGGEAWPVDNMEGIALVRRAGQTPAIYLISDDNFSAAQRTLLLQLDIISPLLPPASGQ